MRRLINNIDMHCLVLYHAFTLKAGKALLYMLNIEAEFKSLYIEHYPWNVLCFR